MFSLFSVGQKSIATLKADFDTAWATDGAEADFDAKIGSSSDNPMDQNLYYAAWNYEGLMNAWQATGDASYWADLKGAIDLLIANAHDINIGGTIYKGFPGLKNVDNPPTGNSYPTGSTLWESYLFRHIWTTMRIIDQSPSFKASLPANWFDDTVTWLETNIWGRFTHNGYNSTVYRENPYMQSHWTRIAMESYIVTGKQEYLDHFETTSFGSIPWNGGNTLYPNGSNLVSRFITNSANANGIDAAPNWASTPSGTTDAPHFSDLVSLVCIATENEMYWHTQTTLIPGMIVSYRDVVMENTTFGSGGSNMEGTFNINGTGSNTTAPVSQGAQLNLGRFEEAYQTLLETQYDVNNRTFNKALIAGILLNNRKILNDGRPVYPENYTPYDGGGSGGSQGGNSPVVDYVPDPDFFTNFTPDRFVSVTGAGNHSGTSEANAWNLSEMLSNAVAGQNIFMKSGTYSSTGNMSFSNSGTSGNPIRVIGYTSTINDIEIAYGGPMDRGDDIDAMGYPIIDVTGTSSSVSFNLNDDYVELYNIGLNGNYNSNSKYGLNVAADNIKIVGCVATGIGDSGSAGAGIIVRNGNNAEIYRSVSYNNEGENIVIQPDSDGFGNDVSVIDNKVWCDNNSHPTDYYLSTSYKGTDDTNTAARAIFRGNIVYRDPNLTHTGHGLNQGGGADGLWEYNTLYNSRTEIRYSTSNGTIFRYNKTFGTTGLELTIENGTEDLEVYGNYFTFNFTAIAFTVKSYGSPSANSTHMPNSNKVYNNIFKWNGNSEGTLISLERYNSGNSTASGFNNVVANNVFDGGATRAIIADKAGNSIDLTNNIVVNHTGNTWLEGSSTTITGSHNIFHNINFTPPGLSNELTSDPLFTGTGTDAEQYQLQSGSPAIDSGTTVTGRTTDFNGNSFIGNPDRGAFEFGTGSTGGGSSAFKVRVNQMVVLTF